MNGNITQGAKDGWDTTRATTQHDLPSGSRSAYITLPTRESGVPIELILGNGAGDLRRVEKIDVSGKRLSRMPAGLCSLTQIYRLHMDDNKMRTLSTELRHLSLLTRLGCAQNQLTALPVDLFLAAETSSSSSSLSTQSSSSITPSTLSSTTSPSTHASSSGNANSPSTGAIGTSAGVHHGSHGVDPSSMQSVACMPLRKLYLNNNRLSTLPQSLGAIHAHLTILALHHNHIVQISSCILALTNLAELTLHHNRLTRIPNAISQLQMLTYLSLAHNQLSTLPDDVLSSLRRLQLLRLRNNHLSNLPRDIGRIQSLSVLTLEANNLSHIPDTLAELSALRELSLGRRTSGNRISHIPFSLGKLTRLVDLACDSNPIASPPPNLLRKGTPAVLSYLQIAHAHGTDWWRQGRILVFGHPRTGRSSLIRALRSCSSSHPHSYSSMNRDSERDREQDGTPSNQYLSNMARISYTPSTASSVGSSNSITSATSSASFASSSPSMAMLSASPQKLHTKILMQQHQQSIRQVNHQAAAATDIQITHQDTSLQLTCVDMNLPQDLEWLLPYFLTQTSLFIITFDSTKSISQSHISHWLALLSTLATCPRILLVGTFADLLTTGTCHETNSPSSSPSSSPAHFSNPSGLSGLSSSTNSGFSSGSQPSFQMPSHIVECLGPRHESALKSLVARFETKVHLMGPIYVSAHTKLHMPELQNAIASGILHLGSSHCQVPLPYIRASTLITNIRQTRQTPICDVKEIADALSLPSPHNPTAVLTDSILPFLQDLGFITWCDTISLRSKIICSPEYFIQIFVNGVRGLQQSATLTGSFSKDQIIQAFDPEASGLGPFIIEFMLHHHMAYTSNVADEYVLPSLLPIGIPPKHIWPIPITSTTTYHSFTGAIIRYRTLPVGLFDSINAHFHTTMFIDQKKTHGSYFGRSHSVFYMSDPKASSSSPKADYHVNLQHLDVAKEILVQVRSLTEALKSWTGIQEILQRIRRLSEFFPGVEYEEYLVCPSCLSMYDSVHTGKPIPIWSLYELDEKVSCGIHSNVWKSWRSCTSSPILKSSSTPKPLPPAQGHSSGITPANKHTAASDLHAQPSLQVSPQPLNPSSSLSRLPSPSFSTFAQASTSYRLPRTPTLFWIQPPSAFSTSDIATLRLVCDRPVNPHLVKDLSYPIPNLSRFLYENEALVTSNCNYFRMCNRTASLQVEGEWSLMEMSSEELEREVASITSRMTEQRNSNAFAHYSGHSWEDYLLEADPKLSWQQSLSCTVLSNGQTRWLCKDCSQQCTIVNISFTKQASRETMLSGVLFKLGGIGKVKSKWQARYCVVDEKAAKLIYYKSEGDRKPAGELDLRSLKIVNECDTPDQSPGYSFSIPTSAKTYYFKTESKSSRNQWIGSLRRVIQANTL
eukprot:TRINITY_DN9898_c0_g1_i3.p1 TRINITY_DN9898_c0_g1~~TRINITY_DN9898_c0_g1_i3.p1  ORF type:complete len:1400 (-),score=283.81 TRINITY_DN9898_c0_g1_i3:371-4570(-)